MATLRSIWDEIVKAWAVVLSICGVIAMGIGVYYQVNENTRALGEIVSHMADIDKKVDNREIDVLQWQKIGTLADRVTVLETWKLRIDALTDPREIQEWGIVKETVRDNKRRLDELSRRPP